MGGAAHPEWLSSRVAVPVLFGLPVAAYLSCRVQRWLQRYQSRGPIQAQDAPAFLRWSAQRLSKAIQTGELRSVDVVDACIQVLKDTTVMNAIVSERYAAAHDAAVAADALLSSGVPRDSLPPFLGVPIVLKETQQYPNMPYTNGLAARRGVLGEKAGPVVRRIEEAGFIVLGFGNTSEACMWMESYNSVYGRTSNPFNLGRTVGGSSGGTCAAVSVLGSPVGVTSDIGGSTRIPALFCGLFGHKPTGGLVPNTGTAPDTFHGAVCRICQIGLATRHASDLVPIMRLIAGPPDSSEDHLAHEYRHAATPWHGIPVDLSRLTVVAPKFSGRWPRSLPEALISSISEPVLAAQDRVVDYFASRGCKVKTVFFEDLMVGEWFNAWSSRLQGAGGPCFREVVSDGKPTIGYFELVRYFLGLSTHTAPALGLAFLEDLFPLLEPPIEQRLAKADLVERTLTDALGDYAVFVLPTLPRHGCFHDELLGRVLDASFTCIWNAMEFPATAVPLGLDSSGLPVGLQIVSTRGNDELTIGVACELERAGLACCVVPGDCSSSESSKM